MEITPRVINEKQFRDAWRGYNQEEVDDFLDKVAETLEEVQGEVGALRERNHELEQAMATSREAEEMLKKTLVTAQRAAEEAIAKAKAKADQLVVEAERRARGANEEARGIVEAAEAEAKRKELAADRESETRRRELDAAIGRLSAYQSELQAKLQAFLTQQQQALHALVGTEPPSASQEHWPEQDDDARNSDASSGSEEAGPTGDAGSGEDEGEEAGGRRIALVGESEEETRESEAHGAGQARGVRSLFWRQEG